MMIVASNSITVSNVNDGTIVHIAYADSPDGKDGFYVGGGGTNLLLNTQSFDSNWNWVNVGHSFANGFLTLSDTTGNGTSRMYQTITDGNLNGKTLSLSFNAKISADCDSQLVQIKAGPYDALKLINITSKDSQLYKIENWQWLSSSQNFSFYVINGKVDISKLKLEYGSVATPRSSIYMGTYTDYTQSDSLDPTAYSWTQVKGADGINGKDGIPGKPGADGKTPYFHTAWATSADGKNGFSLTDSANKSYLGTYTDFTQADSTDTTKYAWSLIKGRDGSNGAPGKAGTDGKTPYFHQAWADSKDGKTNFSATDPTNRGYLGTYSDFTQADSTDPTKYFWVELVGNLQVGGRNYFLNSDFSQAETNWNDANSVWFVSGEKCNGQNVMTATPTVAWTGGATNAFSQTMSTITNQQVTVSVWAKASKSGAKFHSEPNGGNGALNTSLTNTWKRYSYVAQTNTNGTIYFMAVDVGTQYWISMPQVEIGNKATDWSPAPEDTQGQIDTINKGLSDTNSKIAAVTKVDSQATAPTNPKKGDQWWVKDANGDINAFKIWDGTKWADSIIQQSAMNIGTLNGNIINGATINTSDFNMSFDQTNAIDGANKKGVTTIENGEIRTDFQIKSTKQTGYVHLTPEGLSTGSTKLDGTEQNSVSLAFGQIDLASTVGTPSGGTRLARGSLNAEDMEKSRITYWESGDAGNRQKFWMYKQFRRVVLTGVILLPYSKFGTGGNGYRTIFNITDTSLRPLTTRWVKCSSFGDIPHLGLLEFRPNGDVVAIGVPSQGRYSFEGESYAIENL